MSKMLEMLFSFSLNVMLSMLKTLKIDQIHLRAVMLCMLKTLKMGKEHTHTFLVITFLIFNRFSICKKFWGYRGAWRFTKGCSEVHGGLQRGLQRGVWRCKEVLLQLIRLHRGVSLQLMRLYGGVCGGSWIGAQRCHSN